MNFKILFSTAYHNLIIHKSRTILSILGIVIGISSVVLMMSVGQYVQKTILLQIQGFGSKIISVKPGKEAKKPTDFMQTFYTHSLREKDLKALENKSNVPGAVRVSPIILSVAKASYQNKVTGATVLGASPWIFDIFDITPDEGDIFNQEDVKEKRSVIVIGNKLKTNLFGNSGALGKKIRIKKRFYRIIGIFSSKGNMVGYDIDNLVLMPYTTAKQYLWGQDYYQMIEVEAQKEEIVPEVKSDIERTLRENHNITDPDKDDFYVTTQADAAKRISTITDILTILLAAIASISIIVGGIGIMNIMLVSVTERTKEIGLRKALGATNKDILNQFLLEAIILTLAGGLIGIILGTVLGFFSSFILGKMLNINQWLFVFPWKASLLAVIVSVLVGIIFGVYPAKRASQLNPIEALRYE